MPLIDITNPDIIKFLVENYEKTTKLSLKWNREHKEALQQAATLTRAEKGWREKDVCMSSMVAGLAATSRDHTSAAVNRRLLRLSDNKTVLGISNIKKGHSIVDVGLGDPKDDPLIARPDTDLRPDPTMRPVNPEQTAILYKDIPFFGRKVYLKNRFRISPEDRFYFPECGGWTYGWRLKDSPFGRSQTRRGRVFRLNRDVKSRSGPQPDPDHYKSADEAALSKCGD